MRTIGFLSGKGGTGKTIVAANVAFGLADDGGSVLLFDADLGLSNIETVMGVELSTTLANVVREDKPVGDAVTETNYGFEVVAGGTGAEELLRLDPSIVDRLIEQTKDAARSRDYLIFDLAPGLDGTVMKFVEACDEVVVVCTPEATSLTDAYAVIKHLASARPQLKINLVVNMAANEAHGERVAKSLKSVLGQFLSIEVRYLGAVRRDKTVEFAVSVGRLVTDSQPKAGVSQDLFDIAYALNGTKEEGQAPGSILAKIKSVFGKKEVDLDEDDETEGDEEAA